MPHLTFWNRYWRVAGDEFSIPAFCSILARVFWTLLISIVFAITMGSLLSCSEGWIFIIYLAVSIAVFVFTIMCDIALLMVSLKGSITETEQRSSLGFYLNIKIMLGGLQLFCALFGLITLCVGASLPCNSKFERSSLTRAFITVLVVSQLVDVTSLMCCCYLFSANKIDEDDHHNEPKDQSWALNTWESRCRRYMRSFQICSCNIFGGSNLTEGFDEVAKVLTDFFHHDGFLDVVPSDVVAGIVLVRIEQRSVRRMNALRREKQQGQEWQGLGSDTTPSSSTSSRRNNFDAIKSVPRVVSYTYDKNRAYQDIDGSMDAVEDGDVHHSRYEQRAPTSTAMSTNGDADAQYSTIDVELLENISRCSVFALAIYTHLIVLYMRPCTGLCRLTCGAGAHTCSSKGGCTCCLPGAGSGKTRDSARTRGRGSVVEGDNFCGLNYTGLSIVTENLADTELVYVSFKNDIVHKVYAIFLDHEKEQVVIAIRGTLSLEDCITDVICDPAPLEAVGEQFGFDGKGRYAHAGMLKAALGIRAELEANDVLGRIYGGTDTTLKTPLRGGASCAHYKLVVTGHSLGAGSAVLLALIMQKSFPSLHCYAFGTPGSVLDKRTCKDVSSFVTSVVLGNDLVCRLNFRSLCRLRNDVLDAISRARVNKMMIMQAIFKDFDAEDLMYPPGQEPDSPFKRSITAFKDLIWKRLQEQNVELGLPGKIVHFAKTNKAKACMCNSSDYIAKGAALEEFEEILMSTTMGAEHLPDVYYFEIKKILNDRLTQMTV